MAFLSDALRPCEEDLIHIARLQYEAFGDDPAFNAIFPGPPTDETIDHLADQYRASIQKDDGSEFLVIKDENTHTVVAYAVCHFLPETTEQSTADGVAQADPHTFPPGTNVDLAVPLLKQSMDKRVEVASKHFGPGQPYMFLSVLGSKPAYRRKRAASKLLQWIVNRADAMNLPAYVESTPMAHDFYRGFQFQDKDHLDLSPVTKSTFVNICMIRYPETT